MVFFIGTSNIASAIPMLKDSLIEAGHKCITSYDTVNHTNIISGGLADYPIYPPKDIGRFANIKSRLIAFYKVCKMCDVFIFYWSSFSGRGYDLKLLKSLGKKIIFVATGEEIRWPNATNQDFSVHGLKPTEYGAYADGNYKMLNGKLRKIRYFEKYADHIYSRRDQSQLQLRNFYNFFAPISLNRITENSKQNKIPTIVHAPSNPTIKGTKYVIDTINKLESEGIKFEFKLLQNIPHEEAMKLYSKTDIIIDQIFLPGGGALTTEGLAAGCVVLTLMGYKDYNMNYEEDCPVIDVNSNTIYIRLKELILDQEKRQKIADQGRVYVEKYRTYDIFANKMINLAEKGYLEEEMIQPLFLRNFYEPQNRTEIETINKWTKFVNNEPWYKENVQPINRKGLIF